jgi:diketogulonate reductase-like aldo/keto reductase
MPVPKRVTKGCPSLNKPENKTTSPVPQLELRNGVQVPQLGLGVFLAGQGIQTEQAVLWALEAGYRHIDTAAVYGNEKEVGLALNASGVPRREIFLTGKIWNEHIRKRLTRAAFFQTLENLQTEYLDLCLLHWPVTGTRAAWETLEELYAEGRIRAIGVSNFQQHHLEVLQSYAHIQPMFNQIESHPLFNNQQLIDWCQARDIAVGAWSPLGGPQVPLLQHPALKMLAQKYQRSPAQIVLRWDIQRGLVVIPKSSHQNRIAENIKLFDFALSPEDMQLLQSLNLNLRVGPDPDNFNF